VTTIRTADDRLEKTIAELEVRGKMVLSYTFDPPIPSGTKIVLTAETDGEPFTVYSDWIECPPGGQK
jgi:hypothetical protein